MKQKDEEILNFIMKNCENNNCFTLEDIKRRYEWIVLLSEEAYTDQKERFQRILSTTNSLLIASSFLLTAFIAFFTNLFEENQNSVPFISLSIISLIVITIGIIACLIIVMYHKSCSYTSIIEIYKTYMDSDVSFKHSYSENNGRILFLEEATRTLKRKNIFLKIMQIIGSLSLICFTILICILIILFIL